MNILEGVAMKAKYTFAEFADVWFERHLEQLEDATIEYYTYILRTIKEHIGRRPLAEITTPEIEDFLNKLRDKKYSDSYVRSCRGMLTQIYNRALAYQLVAYNPASLAAKMKSQAPQKKKESFTASECSRLIADLPQDRMGWTIRLMIAAAV